MSLSNILNQNNENILRQFDQMMMLWEDDRGKLLRNINLLKRKNDSTKKMFKLLREKYDILALQLHRMMPINIEKRAKGNDVTLITTNDSSNSTSSNYPNRNNSDVEGFVKINYKGKECCDTMTNITAVPTSLADNDVAALSRSSNVKFSTGNESSRVNQLDVFCNTNRKPLELPLQSKPLPLSKNSTDKALPRIDNKSSNINPNKSLVIDSPPSSSSKKQKRETENKMFSNTKNSDSSISISNSNFSGDTVIVDQLPNKLSTLNNSNTTKNGISIQSKFEQSTSNAMPPPLQLSSKLCIPSIQKPEKVVKYTQSVRNKSLREIMPGHTCTECNAYYDALRQQGITFNDYDMKEMLRKCSRHKQEWIAPSTPDGFWDCEVNTPDDWKK